ncbi:hypothetical protein K431DRAFT_77561 [Polychaeton citri CBS 116435]|uniref:Uncharacterized protein n=1 Tax=Polychaeton citri CBS 116435 TaxID=1314669 RepID=A0A9P4QIA2_9PEZI|nr:hypothetical protein K431DRAFT_77561 [Polychaeton citri CBS 116435]
MTGAARPTSTPACLLLQIYTTRPSSSHAWAGCVIIDRTHPAFLSLKHGGRVKLASSLLPSSARNGGHLSSTVAAVGAETLSPRRQPASLAYFRHPPPALVPLHLATSWEDRAVRLCANTWTMRSPNLSRSGVLRGPVVRLPSEPIAALHKAPAMLTCLFVHARCTWPCLPAYITTPSTRVHNETETDLFIKGLFDDCVWRTSHTRAHVVRLARRHLFPVFI